eukprot:scaffold227709_cov17-Tisochrysis_lutea.AAC.1
MSCFEREVWPYDVLSFPFHGRKSGGAPGHWMPNQRRVMRQIFGGMTNAECAQRLVSSPSLMSTPSATLQAQFEDL